MREQVIEALERVASEPSEREHQRELLVLLGLEGVVPLDEDGWNEVTQRVAEVVR